MSNLLGLAGYGDESEEDDDDDEEGLDTKLTPDEGGGVPPTDEEAPVKHDSPYGLKKETTAACNGSDEQPTGRPSAQSEAAEPGTSERLEESSLQQGGSSPDKANTTAPSPADLPRLVIPDAPIAACRPDLQARIVRLLAKQQSEGIGILDRMVTVRSYRNPRYMEDTVNRYQISQYGTCFRPSVLDPDSMPPEDFLPAVRQQVQARKKKAAAKCQAASLGKRHPASAPASAAASLLHTTKRNKWDK